MGSKRVYPVVVRGGCSPNDNNDWLLNIDDIVPFELVLIE